MCGIILLPYLETLVIIDRIVLSTVVWVVVIVSDTFQYDAI
jgi:hypothetical protein